MNPMDLMAAQGGVATAAALRRWGAGREHVDTLLAKGELLRVRRGAYVRPLPDPARPVERYAQRCAAIVRTMPPTAALAGPSALAARGLPLLGELPAAVHVVRSDWHRGQSHGPGVCLHGGTQHPLAALPVEAPWPGVRAVDAGHASMQVAAGGGLLQAKAALDAVLHADPHRRDGLAEAASAFVGRGSRHVRRLLDVADGRIESPGESWLHLILLQLGHEPELQAVIRDADGFVARVDFLLGRTVIEFDGAVKYTDDTVWLAEKRREHRLRSAGYRVVRVMWPDLPDPARVARLLREAA